VLDYAGIQELIASHQGSVVVVDVWSTSCAPCLREFPGLVALDAEYGDEVACISLNIDYTGARNRTPEDYRERVMTWLERFGATFENVLAAEGTDAMLAHLDLAAPPGVYVYDQQGELVRRFDNVGISGPEEEFSYEDVGTLVAELLQQPPAP
jgi:thiol-disulfide isomerase/thioredoxin